MSFSMVSLSALILLIQMKFAVNASLDRFRIGRILFVNEVLY
jgi:hypothetical protein